MTLNPYTPQMDVNGGWFPQGPGDGFNVNGGVLFAETRVETKAEAERLCKLLNRAYREGDRNRARSVQMALGIAPEI